jgi:hypothetical protein
VKISERSFCWILVSWPCCERESDGDWRGGGTYELSVEFGETRVADVVEY